MTALVKAQPAAGQIVAGVTLPPASRDLVAALDHVANPHPDVGLEPARVRPGVRGEAKSALEAIDSALRVATADQWAAFLRPLAALPNGPSRDAFPGRASAIAFALHDTPAAVLTVANQREALRTLRFWPSPHDLDAILRPQADELRRHRRLLLTIATAPETAAPPPLTEAERERIADGLAELRASLARDAADRAARRQVTPRYLTPEQLRAARDAAGVRTPNNHPVEPPGGAA